VTDPASPIAIEPPDDSGSDTFARFRYQARVTFPYCLSMLLQRGVLCVIPEHIEDIAVEFSTDWILVQVKSRDPALGPWRITRLLETDGGLRGLWRSFQALQGRAVRLELHVEGHVARNDLAAELLSPNGSHGQALCQLVSERLGIPLADATAFLGQVTVREAPLRRSIRAENLNLIAEVAPGLTTSTAAAIHDGVVDRICEAMAREIIGDAWPRHVVDPNAAPNDVRTRVERKRLTPDLLEAYRRLLTPPPSPALLPRSDGESTMPRDADSTDLARKLREAGAPDDLVQRARHLRAAAVRHEFELFAKTLEANDRRLDDLQERLLTEAIASASVRRGQPNAAAQVFNDLRASVHANRATIDPNNLFGQDPMLLLGELCELSDQCRTDWGA